MPRFAANLTLMYNEHGFLDRFEAAAKDGFKAVEFLFPYEYPSNEIQGRLRDNGLTQVLFTSPSGDWAGGERGIASLPGRQEDFRESIETALEYGLLLGIEKLNVMAGLIGPNDSRQHHREIFLENLSYAAERLSPHGIGVVIEPISTRHLPGFFLERQDEALSCCAEVGSTNLSVLCDLYHCQMTEGDLASRLRRGLTGPSSGIGHIQIAGVPSRQEPDLGEVNFPFLFDLIDQLGYKGWIGCEYRPKNDTSDGLGWLERWQTRPTDREPG